MNNYFQGNLVRVRAQFKNESNALADPGAIIAKVTTPAGVETTYTYGVGTDIVRESLGIYHIDIEATEPDVWSFRFVGTGAVTAASQDQFLCVAANPA